MAYKRPCNNCRWLRHRKYNVCLCQGKNKSDRYSESPGGKTIIHSNAVSDRVCSAVNYRRLVGLVLVFIGTLLVNYLYDLNMFLTANNIIMAIFISGIIGIIAGYAPAYSAAKMDPVEAIGYSF